MVRPDPSQTDDAMTKGSRLQWDGGELTSVYPTGYYTRTRILHQEKPCQLA